MADSRSSAVPDVPQEGGTGASGHRGTAGSAAGAGAKGREVPQMTFIRTSAPSVSAPGTSGSHTVMIR